jgi:WhiB family redox-sensing transcriptional regulator
MARAGERLRPVSDEWEWQILGHCRDRHGMQYFHPEDDMGRISRRAREAAARRVCQSCPVRAECATHALRVGEEYGVWGGFSESDRLTLRRLGWHDTVGPGDLADVAALDRRLASARSRVSPGAQLSPTVRMSGPPGPR